MTTTELSYLSVQDAIVKIRDTTAKAVKKEHNKNFSLAKLQETLSDFFPELHKRLTPCDYSNIYTNHKYVKTKSTFRGYLATKSTNSNWAAIVSVSFEGNSNIPIYVFTIREGDSLDYGYKTYEQEDISINPSGNGSAKYKPKLEWKSSSISDLVKQFEGSVYLDEPEGDARIENYHVVTNQFSSYLTGLPSAWP